MTTKVIVDAHAGWPVKVQALDNEYDHEAQAFSGALTMSDLGVVAPGEIQEFHATDSRKIVVSELRRPEG